jgi:WXG100 family type VII secretion target
MVNNSMTAQGMQETSTRFAQGVGHVNSLRTRLQSQMDILSQRWGGKASTTFSQVMGEWCQEHAKVIQALDDIAQKLNTGGQDVSASEDQSAHDAKFFNTVNSADHGSH